MENLIEKQVRDFLSNYFKKRLIGLVASILVMLIVLLLMKMYSKTISESAFINILLLVIGGISGFWAINVHGAVDRECRAIPINKLNKSMVVALTFLGVTFFLEILIIISGVAIRLYVIFKS